MARTTSVSNGCPTPQASEYIRFFCNKSNSSSDIAKKICYRCFEKGLILIYLGGNTLRVQPPLIMTDEEAKKAMDIIQEVFLEYEDGKILDSVLEKIQGW